MHAIETIRLTKRYQLGWRRGEVLALDALDLQVQEGEIYGLLGPNGSGKSTTLKLVLNLILPTAGEARIFGRDCMTVGSRLEVGFLPENPYFYRYLTGAETLKFYGRLCGVPGRDLNNRIEEMLQLTGMTDARNRRLAGYSKGMLQRIGIAQAMVHNPKLVLLDEPTAGVDPIGSREIRDMIFQLKRMGKTVLLCSHLLEQVQEVCDRIAILHRGRKIMEGHVKDLVSDQRRTQIMVENFPDQARDEVRKLVESKGGKFLSADHPQSTLESLFLEAVKKARSNDPGSK
jgi:ABC-2 type transport system ATP-binding protein